MALPTEVPLATNYFTEFYDTTATNSNNTFDNATLAEVFLERLAITINALYTPILVVLGTIGNIISILVFYKNRFRSQSTGQYLTALAISDLIFLWLLVPPWLKVVGASRMFVSNGYCQGLVYLSYVASSASSWLVVGFTLERFVAVVYPLRRNAMCTVRRARIMIGTLTAGAILVNLPVLWFAVPADGDCHVNETMMAHAERFNLFDTVFSFTLPLSIIVVLNAWIMVGVYRLGRARGNMMQQSQAHGHQMEQRQSVTTSTKQQRVTRMLLIVSSIFVILNLPAYSMRIIAYTNTAGEQEYSVSWAAMQQVSHMCFNTNFAINFLLYCLTGQNFRSELVDTIPWLRRRTRELIAMQNLTGRRRRTRASSTSTASFACSTSNNDTSHSGVRRSNAGAAQAGQRAASRDQAPQPGPSRAGAGGSTSRCGALCASTPRRESPYASTPRGSLRLQAETSRDGRTESPEEARTGLNFQRYEINRAMLLRRRKLQVIHRWRFDNSRQRRVRLELQPPAAATMPLPLANI